MLFSDFAERLFNIIGAEYTQPAFAETLFINIVDDDYYPNVKQFQDPENFKAYYSGKNGISKVGKSIRLHLQPEKFENYILSLPGDTSRDLSEAFLTEIPDINIGNYHEKLAELFVAIIKEAAEKKKNSKQASDFKDGLSESDTNSYDDEFSETHATIENQNVINNYGPTIYNTGTININ